MRLGAVANHLVGLSRDLLQMSMSGVDGFDLVQVPSFTKRAPTIGVLRQNSVFITVRCA